MPQYSRIVVDRIRDSYILSEIRGCFCESRITVNESAEQTGTMGQTGLRLQEQRSECKGLVQGKRDLRTDLLQMAEAAV